MSPDSYSRDRATLHESKIEDFAQWCVLRGYRREPTKGAYEVLRLRKGEARPLIFHQRDRSRHATIQHTEAMRLVRAFVRARHTMSETETVDGP